MRARRLRVRLWLRLWLLLPLLLLRQRHLRRQLLWRRPRRARDRRRSAAHGHQLCNQLQPDARSNVRLCARAWRRCSALSLGAPNCER